MPPFRDIIILIIYTQTSHSVNALRRWSWKFMTVYAKGLPVESETRGVDHMSYILRTPAGTFTIQPDEAAQDTVMLCIGGMWLASFRTSEEASTAVTKRETGWPDWDRSLACECPACLTDWEEC
jgi:hypothetical protein